MRFAVGDIVVIAARGRDPRIFYGPTGRGTVTKADDDHGYVYVDFHGFHADGVQVYIDARELRLVSAPDLLADLDNQVERRP